MSTVSNFKKLPDATVDGRNPWELLVEVGTVTYDTTDSEAILRTELTNIIGGTVNITGAVSSATEGTQVDTVSVPLGAVSSGAITLTRSSKGASAGKYSVVLYGHSYDTN